MLKIIKIYFPLLIVIFMLSGCLNAFRDEINYDKQDEFIAMFPEGMTPDEVNEIVGKLQDVNFVREYYLGENKDKRNLVYKTSIELYGAYSFTFMFSEDDSLERVTAMIVLD